MPKTKWSDSEEKTEGSSESPIPVEPAETRWTVGMWSTFSQWRCALCPFDTLDGLAAIEAHWLAEHAPPVPPPVEKIQIYDRFGNPVN